MKPQNYATRLTYAKRDFKLEGYLPVPSDIPTDLAMKVLYSVILGEI